MIFKEFIQSHAFDTYLVDVAGVLFTQAGYTSTATQAFNTLQQTAPTFLATNNSYFYPNHIIKNLDNKASITLSASHIFSSGHGLAHDPSIVSLLTNKCVYFLGQEASLNYILDAPIAGLTQNPRNADVIVLANYTPEQAKDELNNIINAATKSPSMPVICCNPDRHIQTNEGLYHVMGHYADMIQKNIPQTIHWFGKPHKNFSKFVANHLSKTGITNLSKVLLFDDNLENITAMQTHLGLQGCWIHKTGIMADLSTKDAIQQFGKPTYLMNAFDLNAELQYV